MHRYIILSGIVPSAVRPVLFGGRLTALRKKCGGIRPIAVGSTLRRLAAKILCRRLRPLGGVLAPTQLGFAVRSGCEAAIHATRGYCSSASCSSAGEPQVLLKVDFANAFNSIFRDVILEETYSSAPMAATYAYQAYGAPSALRFAWRPHCMVEEWDSTGGPAWTSPLLSWPSATHGCAPCDSA